jgi:hypothetical protein
MAAPQRRRIDQGQTFLCWLYSTLECFTAAGSPFDWRQVYADVKGARYVAPGEPATFDELKTTVLAASQKTGASVSFLGDDGFLRNDAERLQAVRDGWFVIVGVTSGSLNHFLIEREDAPTGVVVVDSYAHEDMGIFSGMTLEEFNAAVHDFPSGNVEALAFKIAAGPALEGSMLAPPPLTREAQLVTILSVIGDSTYPDRRPVSDAQRQKIRQLVQAGKALLGA